MDDRIENANSQMEIIKSIVPESLFNDPWLLFHGTSNLNKQGIDDNGLQPNQSFFKKEELEKVVAIFDKLHWCGEHQGGFAVLKPFSLGHDFNQEEGKPIYLAESVLRASLYASKEFSGGEVCRALYYCFQDLRNYIANENTREMHHKQLNYDPAHLRVPLDSLPTLEWLIKAVEELEYLESRVKNVRNNYEHGLIYAIRLNPKNISNVEYKRGGMGIKCFRAVNKCEIVDIFEIPATYEHESQEDLQRRRARLMDGIVSTIRVASEIE